MAIEGLDAFQRRLEQLPARAVASLRSEMEKSAEKIVETMRRLVPVDDGALRASISWTWGAPPGGAIALASVVSGGHAAGASPTDTKVRGSAKRAIANIEIGAITIFAGNDEAFYARWVEFGTRAHSLFRNASVERGKRQDLGAMHPGARAEPFFFPAFRMHSRSTRAAMTRAFRRAMQET